MARALAGQGARLLLTARRAERLAALVAELQASGAEALSLAGDITDAAHRQAVLELARGRLGGLDVLINNAGVGAMGAFAQAGEARLRRIMEVNFFAPAELTRAALPLLQAGRRPLIVNVGSVLGHCAVPYKSEYCASKFALHGFSDALRCELVGAGVDVLLVSPSTTQTEFFDNVLERQTPSTTPNFGMMSSDSVARQIVRAMRSGRHEIILSAGGKLLVWLDRLWPTLVSRLLVRFVKD